MGGGGGAKTCLIPAALAVAALVLVVAPALADTRWTVHTNGSGVTDSNISVETPTINYGSAVTATCRKVLSFEQRCLFRFDYSAFVPSGATRILDAQLSLYTYTVPAPGYLEAHRVTENWIESQVTWNNRQTGTPWGTAGGSFAAAVLGRSNFTSSGVRTNISVQDTAMGHWNGTYPNYGFMIRNSSAFVAVVEVLTNNYVLTTGKPWLYVQYVLPTANPIHTAQLINDGTINWTWTNPVQDPDFSFTQVFLNGSFVANTTGAYYNSSGLDPFNCRLISLRSVNLYGDLNQSWSNRSDCTTNSVPPPPISGLDRKS